MKMVKYALLLTLLASCAKKPPAERPPPSVIITPVVQRDVPIFIEAPGHIEAYNNVELRSQVTGVVTGVYYDQGTEVDEGQLLVTIDKRPFEASVKEAEADVARSMASLKYAQDTTRRNTPLVQEDYVSQDAYDNLVTNVLVDDATVKANLAQLDIAKVNLDYCTIDAPMDSIAGERLVDVGNLVLEDGQSTLVVLNQIKPIYCSFSVSERYFSKIQSKLRHGTLETHVSYTNDFKEIWKGEVEFIDNAVDETTGMIKIKSTFPNMDKALWPGIFVYTRLILEIDKGALLVPTGAVVTTQKGKHLFVMRGRDSVEQVDVEVGQIENDFIIIKKGLKPDEKVVLSGQLNLADGSKVTVTKEQTFSDESF